LDDFCGWPKTYAVARGAIATHLEVDAVARLIQPSHAVAIAASAAAPVRGASSGGLDRLRNERRVNERLNGVCKTGFWDIIQYVQSLSLIHI